MNKGSTQLSLPRSLACKNARPGLFLAFNPEVFHSMSRNWLPLLVPASLILLIWMLLPVSDESNAMTSGLPERPDYNFHVKPILSDKCFACHGPDEKQRKAGLRLDIREEAMAELTENSGRKAILPGEPAESILVARIRSVHPGEIMPPPESNLFLTEQEKEILEKWIAQGAEYKTHWAFIPPVKADLPLVSSKTDTTHPVDAFVAQKLAEFSLVMSPEARPEQLVRRLYLDLTGLPPTPEEVDAFLKDRNAGSYEMLVDRLLSSEAYAEYMTQLWLDVARYADSHGYQDDSYRSMWPWRDWVINAFRTNMPYDRFITLQIAGDLLPGASAETILATGFNRNHPITQEGGVIDEEYRSAYISDRTNTLGKGILGLTLECAKCHDHKYDPITQHDYFSFYAFFNMASEKGLQMDAVQAASRRYYADAPSLRLDPTELQDIIDFIRFPDNEPVEVMVMNDSTPRETYVLARGEYDQPTERVEPATPGVILGFDPELPRNRLGLALWLTSPQNPLTARVFVNRLWAMLFGRGLVETVEDFGNQGQLPSHPELLDWLAADFMEKGWDVRAILKTIVSSATYRQRSETNRKLRDMDPENILLGRGPRYRMSSEMIRDYMLATSGLLINRTGGPSVKPYQPPGLWEETNAGGNRGILTAYIQDHGDKLYRRSLYTFWKRTLPPPSMTLFDAPNRDNCEVRRQKTNTPLQALALQNDVQVLEAARVIAERSLAQHANGEEAVEKIFRNIMIRQPSSAELGSLIRYYQANMAAYANDSGKAELLLQCGESPKAWDDPVTTASLMLTALVLYNLDETITIE